MIDRCRAFGKFERSQAGDQLSPVRTSITKLRCASKVWLLHREASTSRKPWRSRVMSRYNEPAEVAME